MSPGPRPAVDLLVVSWNSRDTLGRCLESAARQLQVEVHVVVVDNASTDGSAEMVAADFPGAELVREPANVGYTVATNDGLARCRGDYVLLCNPDCELMPGTTAALVAFLEETPAAAGVAPRLFDDRGVQDFCYRFASLPIAIACYTETGRRLDERLGGPVESWRARRDLRTATTPVAVDHSSAACLLMRRDALMGGLDASMPLFFSDVDLSYRLRAAGRAVYFDPRASARHLQGVSVDRLGWRLMRHEMRRGLRRFYRLHRGPAARAALDTILVTDALARAAFRGLRARSIAASREELGWLPRLLGDRPGPGTPWVE